MALDRDLRLERSQVGIQIRENRVDAEEFCFDLFVSRLGGPYEEWTINAFLMQTLTATISN